MLGLGTQQDDIRLLLRILIVSLPRAAAMVFEETSSTAMAYSVFDRGGQPGLQGQPAGVMRGTPQLRTPDTDSMRFVPRMLALIILLLLSTGAHAEGGCPPGQYPQQGQGWQNCVPIPGYVNQQVQQAPPERWENHWQAVAADMAKGELGTSTGARSKSDANLAAISDCRSKGGTSCIVRVSQLNGCIAVAVGEKTAFFRGAGTSQEANQKAETECASENSKCVLYYQMCDLPVRTQ